MSWPLFSRLPARDAAGEGPILDRFLEFVRDRGLDLYPAQEEAILELLGGKNVILNTPTGSGKSLVAQALQFDSLARGRRSFYTSPIKALVNEKFFALCRDFGPEQVGMITGDATVNPHAPIICCTAEILANDALRSGTKAQVDDVIMDEFHFYSDRERGVAWQIPLLALPQARFLLMSATLGDTSPFEKALTALNGRETVVVRSTSRPVPLEFSYSEDPLHDAVMKLIRAGRAPIYLVSFTQRECVEEAQNFLSIDLCTKEEKKRIAEALDGFKFSSPYGKELQRFLRHGMGIHHAGLLPKYRGLVERLSQKGLFKIIFGTDTLGVGVNIPIRTVLLNKLCKYDGQKTAVLSVRDFQQVCGRAGRKGFDDLGTVVVQAPEHVIENIRNEQKAAGDPKKLKKLVKRKPPEKGYVPWNQETMKKLIDGQPEALVSRFKVTHGMLLSVLSRDSGAEDGDGCVAMRRLIRDCHESENSKRQLRKVAFQLFRSLVERKIIELDPLRVNVELQEDFSLNHDLSLFLVDALKLVDPTSPEHAMTSVTLIESILENPDAILRSQLNRVKTDKMQELKASGMEYDERIEELEKLEYPKPDREFVYTTFNAFFAAHPWVGEENIRPKSIAREMYEGFHSFAEYVREYELQRSEGLLLRYISEFYKTLIQNVPGYDQDDELLSVALYFGSMLRQIDSSLIDEWERLRDPSRVAAAASSAPGEEAKLAPADITAHRKAFTVMIRNDTFLVVKALAAGDWDEVLMLAPPAEPARWTPVQLEVTAKEYIASGHSRVCTDAKARGPGYLQIQEASGTWRVTQVLTDPEEHNDWVLELSIDLARSREAGRPALELVRIGPIE